MSTIKIDDINRFDAYELIHNGSNLWFFRRRGDSYEEENETGVQKLYEWFIFAH